LIQSTRKIHFIPQEAKQDSKSRFHARCSTRHEQKRTKYHFEFSFLFYVLVRNNITTQQQQYTTTPQYTRTRTTRTRTRTTRTMETAASYASYSAIDATFLASIRSVGTACTLAAVGIYLHRRGFVIGDGKRTLALISQQVTIPLFLFTKIIYCNQDWSSEPCPDVIKSLEDVWVLLLWPAYVVGMGLLVGYLAAKLSNTPKNQVRAVLAACGFGNSTGLPITLLSVVHANVPATSDLGRIDPCLFLSVYLLLYPVLQWGVGGWLLAPEEEEQESVPWPQDEEMKKLTEYYPAGEAAAPSAQHDESTRTIPLNESSAAASAANTTSLAHNVLNNRTMEQWYKYSRRGMNDTDASLYMSVQENLDTFQQTTTPALQEMTPLAEQHTYTSYYNVASAAATADASAAAAATTAPTLPNPSSSSEPTIGMDLSDGSDDNENDDVETPITFNGREGEGKGKGKVDNDGLFPNYGATGQQSILQSSTTTTTTTTSVYQEESLWETLAKIGSRCLQPPVVGALLGMFVAATPLRGIFVDLIDRGSHAPLEWFFDGLYAVGQAAVPMNMMILGCNLSASAAAPSNDTSKGATALLSNKTMAAIVIGKMLVMPIVGFASAFFFRSYFWDIPDGTYTHVVVAGGRIRTILFRFFCCLFVRSF
jgi:predicted permease